MRRQAFVSGRFYPSDKKELYEKVDGFLSAGEQKARKAKAVISPHAGYVFSGKTAGMTYSSVIVPDNVIILSPNHTGLGKPVALMNEGVWEIPGAEIKLNSELANTILEKSSYAVSDWKAHAGEHSIEVQLPFIFRKNPSASIVPITLMGRGETSILSDLSSALVSALRERGEEALIVASNDMSHFISREAALNYDNMAIDKIRELNGEGLLNIVKKENISMCGSLASAIAIEASKKMGAREAQMIHYSTSADVTGNSSEVVGYAGIRIV
ncbi:MAG: AmmeMemoRadiSam system protein B [Elusimicrobiota bacterium]